MERKTASSPSVNTWREVTDCSALRTPLRTAQAAPQVTPGRAVLPVPSTFDSLQDSRPTITWNFARVVLIDHLVVVSRFTCLDNVTYPVHDHMHIHTTSEPHAPQVHGP